MFSNNVETQLKPCFVQGNTPSHGFILTSSPNFQGNGYPVETTFIDMIFNIDLAYYDD